jgi:hypothetical protein
LRAEPFEYFGCDCWVCHARGQYFPVLRVRRPSRANRGHDGDDCNRGAHVISARVHRRASPLERHQRARKLVALARTLSEIVLTFIRDSEKLSVQSRSCEASTTLRGVKVPDAVCTATCR